MRHFKKTVFWFLILFVLGGAFYLFDRKTEEGKAEAEEARRLVKVGADDIVSLTIQKKGQGAVTVEKVGEGWVLTSPVKAGADTEEVKKYLEKLSAARYDGVLYENASKEELSEMGLSEPALTVEAVDRNGVRSAVYFGDRGPTHNVSFAAVKGDARAFRVNTDVLADADRDAYQMREKRLLSVDPTRASMVEIDWTGAERIRLEQKTEGKWNTAGLADGRTGFMKVMEMLVKLKAAKVSAFVEEEASDLSKYGLAAPRAVLSFFDAKANPRTLAIGARDKERRGYYAVRDGGKAVVLIEEDLVDSLARSPLDLEDNGDGPQAHK